MTCASSPEKPQVPQSPTTDEDNTIPTETRAGTSPQSPSPDGSEESTTASSRPDVPLPTEPPPLPDGPPPGQDKDDGWDPVWDPAAQAFYFYNRITQVSQWENPRIPDAIQKPVLQDNGPPGTQDQTVAKRLVAGGYDPAIHGDFDPNADYAKVYQLHTEVASLDTPAEDSTQTYAAIGAFNRFTGKWQKADLNPENFNDENKSKRQMNAFFDVDAAANSHDGKSLKAERSNQKLTKKELKAFRDKRREKKEEKRRAWLRD